MMDDVKHTPGPWVADFSDLSDVVVWAGTDVLVANVGANFQRVDIAFDCDAANARLIAAAPDMLEALLWIAANKGAHPNNVQAVVASAIAKATGGV